VTALQSLCAIALTVTATAAATPARIALVIGNSDYTDPKADLSSPAPDALAIGEALCSVGFDVDHLIDGKQRDMVAAIARHQARLEANPKAETVVFYGGHGAQYGGQTFLIPTDLRAVTEEGFVGEAVELGALYDAFLYGEPQFALLIVDACRNNPFTRRDGPIQPGLAMPGKGEGESVAPAGTIIAFATSPGTTVSDSTDGRHSAYTKAVLYWLGVPGQTLTEFFIEVRKAVAVFTDKRQTTWENTSQNVPFMFREPAFLEVAATGNIDDELMITAGGGSFVSSLDGRFKQLRLLPGDNVITATVVNFRSKNSMDLREGWQYDVTLRDVGSPARLRFRGTEHEPPPQRWGHGFIAARALAHVDRLTGEIRFLEQEPVVWENGLSLIGTRPVDLLYETVRWAVQSAGVPFFADVAQYPGRRRTIDEIAADVAKAHRAALTHKGPSPHAESDEEAHRSYVQALEILRRADEPALQEAIERIRGESRPEIEANLAAMFTDAELASTMRAFAAAGRYFEVRYFYSKQMGGNVGARHLLGTISNAELDTILRRLAR
jgi:hypothetical protein